jgi:predicted amidohydrolase
MPAVGRRIRRTSRDRAAAGDHRRYPDRVRIHVLQVAYGDGEPVAERTARVADLVRAQRGADLVVLPELWAAGGFAYQTWDRHTEVLTASTALTAPPGPTDPARPTEPTGSPTVTAIAAAAREIGAVVHAGSVVETVPDGAPAQARGETGRGRWNTSVLLGPAGAVLATYRKIHRFGFGAGEPLLLEAGQDVVTVRLTGGSSDGDGADGGGADGGGADGGGADGGGADGADAAGAGVDGAVVGLATCYDLRFPELFRLLLDAGAQLVLVPAAWPLARVEAWTLLGRARAIENQFVVVQCNTGGTHAGVPMGGRSQVVAATGEVLAQAGEGEEVLVVDVDLADVEAWRRSFPVLADRRL